MSEHEPEQATNAQAQSENESLRRELDAENVKLREQIAATRQQASGGMTEQDVRRAEHPEEFADEKVDAGEPDPEPASTTPVAPAPVTGPNDEAVTTGQLPEHDLTLLEKLDEQAAALRRRLLGTPEGGQL